MKNQFYEKLGITTVINAADSYTMIGGSIMPQEVLQAMIEASRSFISLEKLHLSIGARIAELTHNQAAVVTSGAAAGLTVAIAACMAGTDEQKAKQLPDTEGIKHEVLIYSSQRNGFDKAITLTGAKLVEVDDHKSATTQQLESEISDRTACIVYFVASNLGTKALPLQDVIRIANDRGIPVVVDAAAQLPPIENLWVYTEMGAAMVIFSGGKTLCGPQSTGFIVGKETYIEACRLHVGARESIGRPMKVGKEELAGLLAAIERYIKLDHASVKQRHERIVHTQVERLRKIGYIAKRSYPGPTGQDYPVVSIDLSHSAMTAIETADQLLSGVPSILVALSQNQQKIIINPLHLRDDEVDIIVDCLEVIKRSKPKPL